MNILKAFQPENEFAASARLPYGAHIDMNNEPAASITLKSCNVFDDDRKERERERAKVQY